MIKLLCALAFSLPLMATANDFCQNLSSKANNKGVNFDNTDNVYKVGGKGRLYFYSAPDEKCIKREVFVVPGNELYAYVEYKDYYSVMYVTNDGNQVDGWVKKDRLVETHTGIAPDYDSKK
ncbi:hypothetical protein [Pantoea eucalypti]|uniref:hypothetical protein n=1 Tax=Pantoea eucalypti TaxID=470933 RepID=UPI0009993E7F|nr:hypothetical protein [Pantoea eucalypti]QXG53264.1 hypothetical protein KTJ90_11480 [Pantoea jilinensis]SJZ40372.1 hypothetical protein SAMN03097723_0813 [Pantoea eucalypti]